MDTTRTAPDAATRVTTAPDAPAPAGNPLRRLVAQVAAAARDAAPVHGAQRVVYLAGALLVLSGLLHLGVLAVDGGGWSGPLSWRKPILFGVSFGLSTLAAGWVLGLLRPSRVWGGLTAACLTLGGLVEVGLITMQAWRGTASHFNVAGDPFDALVFTLMAVAVGIYSLGLVVLTGWAAVRLRRPAPTVVAVLVGMTLVLVGSALGGDLVGRGLVHVDAYGTVPDAVVIGAAGSGRLTHAVALHAVQVLGVLALLLGRSALTPDARARTMAVAAGAYVVLTGLVASQAYGGRSMLELTWPLAAGLTAAVLTLVIAFWWSVKDAVLGARRAA